MATNKRAGFLDNVIATLAPGWGAARESARAKIARSQAQVRAIQIAQRAMGNYDAATLGRRSSGWRIVSTDANASIMSQRARMRDITRDLVRNNPLAAKAVAGIAGNVVGAGIIPTIQHPQKGMKKKLDQLALEFFDTTKCDVSGKMDIYGLQAQIMSTVVQSGECIVRRRPRFAKDKLPVPVQFEVLEPDYIDTSISGRQRDGTVAVQGVAFGPTGKIEGYWLFGQHPGSDTFFGTTRIESKFISADSVAHIFRVDRPGQVRGVSWFGPVIMRMKDLDDFKDAHLMRQKIAACFAAFIESDTPAQFDPAADEEGNDVPPLENVEPGLIEHLLPGEKVSFGTPPQVSDFEPYIKSHQRDIAAGLGISYEALTGDLSNVNFSSGRMGWLEFARAIDTWRNYVLIPQGCVPMGQWFLEAAVQVVGAAAEKATIKWTAPRREMVQPLQEINAIRNEIRSGLTSRSAAVRELGYDPLELDNEIAEDNARADSLGLVFDTDARKTSNAGLTQGRPAGTVIPPTGTPDIDAPEPDPNASTGGDPSQDGNDASANQ